MLNVESAQTNFATSRRWAIAPAQYFNISIVQYYHISALTAHTMPPHSHQQSNLSVRLPSTAKAAAVKTTPTATAQGHAVSAHATAAAPATHAPHLCTARAPSCRQAGATPTNISPAHITKAMQSTPLPMLAPHIAKASSTRSIGHTYLVVRSAPQYISLIIVGMPWRRAQSTEYVTSTARMPIVAFVIFSRSKRKRQLLGVARRVVIDQHVFYLREFLHRGLVLGGHIQAVEGVHLNLCKDGQRSVTRYAYL